MIKHIHELFRTSTHPSELNDYYHGLNSSNILNVLYWAKYFEMVEDIPGDIVECGIGRGRSLITILALHQYYEASNKNPQRRKIYGLDSFKGFPEPSAQDASPRNPRKGDWDSSPNKQFSYTAENLRLILEKAGLNMLDDSKLKIVEGFFDKTSANLDVEKIAILHLDGDLYESLKAPLLNLESKISIGGIIVVDDFIVDNPDQKIESFPGARKAIEEFLQDNNSYEFCKSIRGTPYLRKMR